jgi:NitT/TauT family transport system substrate-binding protein
LEIAMKRAAALCNIWRRAALGALLLGLLAGPLRPALANEHIVLQLDWLPTGEKSASVAGVALGYFAENGLDVEIRRGAGAADSLTKVATGAADFGYCDISNVMLTRGQGALVKAIYAIDVQAPHAIITRADTGIKSFTDLPGHTMGTSPTASSNLFFPLILQDAKIDASSIRMINADPSALGPMLIMKRLDAAMLWLTNTPVLKGPAKEAGVDLVTIPFSVEGMNMYSSVIIASDKTLAEKPDQARRFLSALRRAYIFMRDHPQETADLVAKTYPEQNAALIVGALDILNKDMVFPPGVTEDNVGTFDPKLVADTYRWLGRAQDFDVKHPASLFIDGSFLPPFK